MSNISNPGNTPLPCPAWCTTDHATVEREWAERDERIVARESAGMDPTEIEQLRARVAAIRCRNHTRDVAVIPNPEAGPAYPVEVSVYRDDEPGQRPGTVLISADQAEIMSPELAAEVAEAIAEAVRIATGACWCGQPLATDGHCSSTDPGQSWRGRPDGTIETTS